MNTSTKGSKAELEVKKELEKQGYIVEKVRNTKFQRGDLFGIADIIAKRKNETKYIQVKSLKITTGFSKKKTFKLLKDFKEKYGCASDRYELWVKTNNTFNIYVI